MKIRLDYVTNSSSSSFIALNKEEYSTNKLKEQFESIVIGKEGNREFSRFLSESRDFFSKLNFLSLSLLYLDDIKNKEDSWYRNFLLNKNPDFFSVNYKEILNQLIKKELNKKLDWKLIKKMKEDCDSYIDHQSLFEGIPDILKDEDSMKRFLFNDKSIVVFDGDESGCCFQLLDKYFLYNENFDYIDEYLDEESDSGFYLYLESEVLKSDGSKITEEFIRNQLKELLIKDLSISEELIEIYFNQIDIYRIDKDSFSGNRYYDWYEEYVFNNKTCLSGIIDKVSSLSLEEYRKELLENQNKLMKNIIEKLSEDSSIWLITAPLIDLGSDKEKLELEEKLDNLFYTNKLFKEDSRLIYFEGF